MSRRSFLGPKEVRDIEAHLYATADLKFSSNNEFWLYNAVFIDFTLNKQKKKKKKKKDKGNRYSFKGCNSVKTGSALQARNCLIR